MNTVFIDASTWIALYHKRDKYHESAWVIYEQSLSQAGKFLTSNWVAYEAISILKSRASYGAAKPSGTYYKILNFLKSYILIEN